MTQYNYQYEVPLFFILTLLIVVWYLMMILILILISLMASDSEHCFEKATLFPLN